MNLPAPPVFRADDYPETDPKLLELLNRGFRQLFEALVSLPTMRETADKSFTTSDTGTAYLDLKTEAQPRHLWVTDLESAAGEIVAAYSQTWIRRNEGVRILFAGLGASTKHTCSVLYV